MSRSTIRSIRARDRLAWAAFAVPLLTAVAIGQETTRVSIDSAGVQGNADSIDPSISADGQIVAFLSAANDLVAGDTNGADDVFVYDRTTGVTERVSVDSFGAEANGDSHDPSISADGRVVAFLSYATNLVTGAVGGWGDVYVHDRTTGITELVSVDSSGAEGNWQSDSPSISSDGQIVAFRSAANDLVAGDTDGDWDIFVHDRTTGQTERVSVDSSGNQENAPCWLPALSANGQVVAFQSGASNLVAHDTNAVWDVFVHDRVTGITERVSVASNGRQGNLDSRYPAISADGQIVAFSSDASTLVTGDTNNVGDVFVHDRSTGITERVSVASSGKAGDHESTNPSISADGETVAFWGASSNLVPADTNGTGDVFVHHRSTGRTQRASVDSSGTEGNSISLDPSISADGEIVAFWGIATNLVSGDTNGDQDVFVHEFCSTPASWSNYGTGFPGTNGIPSFTSAQNPVLGTTITLDLDNSSSAPTVGLMFVGLQRTVIPTNRGGDLLVVPTFSIAISFSYGFDSFTGDIPDDDDLCGIILDVQAVEDDPGAAKGMSFTQGLELVLGR